MQYSNDELSNYLQSAYQAAITSKPFSKPNHGKLTKSRIKRMKNRHKTSYILLYTGTVIRLQNVILLLLNIAGYRKKDEACKSLQLSHEEANLGLNILNTASLILISWRTNKGNIYCMHSKHSSYDIFGPIFN